MTMFPPDPIGLSDARRIASEMQGRITMWVNEGGAGDETEEKTPPLRILIVENDRLIGVLLGEVLSGMGHEVCAIESTEASAIAAAALWIPDLIIVDAWLEDGNGLAAMDHILRARFIPHIYASGDALRVRTLRPNAIILQKPFRETNLVSAIRRAMTAKRPS